MTRDYERVVFAVHCILNQATRAWWREGGAGWEQGMMRDVVEALHSHGVGIVQMECPEFGFLGNPRSPMSRDEYDTPEFRGHCYEIAQRTCDQIQQLISLGREPKVRVVAVLGMENSPSCAVSKVPRKINQASFSLPGKGILMEVLEEEMRKRRLTIPMLGVSLKPGEREEQLGKLEALLSRGR